MFPKTVSAAYLSLCSNINTPRSLACKLLYESGEHVQFLELEVNAHDYDEEQLEKFRNDYLVTEYLKKYPGLDLPFDTEQVAYSSFTAAELKCKASNSRVAMYETIAAKNPHLARIITCAQRIIESCIRTSPDFVAMSESSRWGKGSTFSIKGEMVRVDAKVCEGQISVTEQALPFVRAAIAEDIALLRARGIEADGPTSLLRGEFCIVHGARGTTVPKNAKTDRFIAIEPSGNVFIQLGYGGLLRHCLRRVGIDLNDQGINQTLARLAWELGLATVDLKAASDTICRELVWLLLPFRWAYALDSARSHMLLVQDKWIHLSKFSSMGNGFTFELETLIFWALTKAVCEVEKHSGRISVYGDDIICPESALRTLREVMDFCGFEVNTKKTHTRSFFRESCGEHFFKGQNVTPIYQKERLESLEAYYRFHNRLAYHAVDRGSVHGDTLLCDKMLRDVIKVAGFNLIDRPHYIPFQGDKRYRVLDGGLVVDARRTLFRFTGSSYAAKRVWVFKPEKLPAWEGAMYAVSLRMGRNNSYLKSSFLYKMSEVRAGARRKSIAAEVEACNYIAIGRHLGETFTGSLTMRDRGTWATKRRLFPQACNVRWS